MCFNVKIQKSTLLVKPELAGTEFGGFLISARLGRDAASKISAESFILLSELF